MAIDSVVYCRDRTVIFVSDNNILKIYSSNEKLTPQEFIQAKGDWKIANLEVRASYELYKQLNGSIEKEDFDKIQIHKYSCLDYCNSLSTLCSALELYSRLPHDAEIITAARLLGALGKRLAQASPHWILQETYRLQGRDPSVLDRITNARNK